MRDEDLAKLPQQVERWRFSELMQELGFEPGWENHTKDIQLGYQGLTVTVYATDSEGRKIARDVPTEIEVQDLGDAEPHTIQGLPYKEPVTHTISIPFSGSWQKPV
jgi:hypothetical protein